MHIRAAVVVFLASSARGCSKREEGTLLESDSKFQFLRVDNSTDPLKQNEAPLINWEQAVIAFPVNVSGRPKPESSMSFIIWAAQIDTNTRDVIRSSGRVCPPGRFNFGRTFEYMEKDPKDPRRMLNYRAAYTQDGFFICGLDGGYDGIKHECCYWSMHSGAENECLLLEAGNVPEMSPNLAGMEMVVTTDEIRPEYQGKFYIYTSTDQQTQVVRGELKSADGHIHWSKLDPPHWADPAWKNPQACPVAIEDKLLLLGGFDTVTQKTPDHNLVYDPGMGHWYKTHSFFDDDFETLSCVVDKLLPRVLVLGKDRNTKKLKLVVANVGWYKKPGTGNFELHLMENPKKINEIPGDLLDGVMFALDPETGEHQEHEILLIGICKKGNKVVPCNYEFYRYNDDAKEIRGLLEGDPFAPLNQYVRKSWGDNLEFDLAHTRFAMVKTTYFEEDCEPFRVMPKPLGAPDY